MTFWRMVEENEEFLDRVVDVSYEDVIRQSYRWWTCGVWRDGFKIGPLAVVWFEFDGWHVSLMLLCR